MSIHSSALTSKKSDPASKKSDPNSKKSDPNSKKSDPTSKKSNSIEDPENIEFNNEPEQKRRSSLMMSNSTKTV